MLGAGLLVFARIDHGANASEIGAPLRPTELLIFGNPKGGTPLMQDRQISGIDLPVKALAWEDGEGIVWLSCNDAHWIAERHGLGEASKQRGRRDRRRHAEGDRCRSRHGPALRTRPALADDLGTVVALTEAAYAPYTIAFGAPPVPVTENYAPRIARGEVTLLDEDGVVAGVLVLERHPEHAMIFSVAVAPAFQGKGFGIALLRYAEKQAFHWTVPEIAALHEFPDGTEHSALHSLRLPRNGPPVQPIPAGLDRCRHGENG